MAKKRLTDTSNLLNMKKLNAGILMLFLMVFVFSSCGNNHQKQIARTWQVTDIETSTELADSTKTQMMEGSQLSFTSDGHYTSQGGIGADQGTYTLDKDGKNLSTVSEAGRSNSVYEIKKLTDDELVLNSNGNTVTCTAKK
jgi:hypothetical protein